MNFQMINNYWNTHLETWWLMTWHTPLFVGTPLVTTSLALLIHLYIRQRP